MNEIESNRSQKPNRTPSRRGEVNLQDFLLLIAVLLGGLAIAAYTAERFGWIGFLLGGAIGLLVSFGILYLFFAMYALIEGVIWEGVPFLPVCANGKCKSGLLTDFGDYEWELDEQDRLLFRCRCGLLYERNRKTGQVREVLPDGSTKPYMIWKPFRGWRPDDTSAQ